VPRTPASDRLPALFLPHEIAVYRGVCSLYMGEASAAIKDFAAAVELAQQALHANFPPGEQGQGSIYSEHEASMGPRTTVSGGRSSMPSSKDHPVSRLPPEVTSQRGLDCFACEAQYNIALCQLVAKQYGNALSTCQHLLDCQEALKDLGPQAICLAWFLIGICNLALGDSSDQLAREAFTQSFANDPRYVDDFLQRHGRRNEPAVGMTQNVMGRGMSPVEPPSRGCPLPPAFRRVGAPYRPVRSRDSVTVHGGGIVASPGAPSSGGGVSQAPGACDAAAEAICCLRPDKSRFSAKLPPLRIQVKDVVIWGRPSAGWPVVRPAGPAPPTGLARLDLLQQQEGLPPIAGGPAVDDGSSL